MHTALILLHMLAMNRKYSKYLRLKKKPMAFLIISITSKLMKMYIADGIQD